MDLPRSSPIGPARHCETRLARSDSCGFADGRVDKFHIFLSKLRESLHRFPTFTDFEVQGNLRRNEAQFLYIPSCGQFLQTEL